jgi:drug/metabolite transporter (DMT)-like permease
MFFSFSAVAFLPVAEATLLVQLAPVFMAIGGVLLLGEKFSFYRAGAVVLALAGMAVLVIPGLNASEGDGRLLGYVLGTLGATLTAGALLTVRRISRTETAGSIAFYFIVVAALAGLATLPLGWVTLSDTQFALLVLSGLFGGAGHIAMTLAFRYAEVSQLAPFEYVALVWPVIADWVLFGMPVSSGFLLALPLMLSGVALAAMEGRRLRLRARWLSRP